MTCARMSNKDCDRFVVYGVFGVAESQVTNGRG